VSCHINADGDAIGSLLAMGSILKRLKKKYWMVIHDNPPNPKFKFLKDFDKILNYQEDGARNWNFDSAVILDTADLDRLGDVKKLLKREEKMPILNVDHHISNTNFGTINLVGQKASSTCELIYLITKNIENFKIDKSLAYQIYTGIIYDTGRFSFSNTTTKSMEICAEMLKKGVDCHEVSKHIYFEKSFESIQLLGLGLKSMELYLNGKVGLIAFEKRRLSKNQNSVIDLDSLVNYATAVKGVEVGILLREEEKGRFRVSLRSKDRVDVNKIAKVFNGGGHFKAAGCYIKGNLKETINQLLRELQRVVK